MIPFSFLLYNAASDILDSFKVYPASVTLALESQKIAIVESPSTDVGNRHPLNSEAQLIYGKGLEQVAIRDG